MTEKQQLIPPKDIDPIYIDYYFNGRMNREQMMAVEEGIRSGRFNVPPGKKKSDFYNTSPGIVSQAFNAITGANRQTEETETLPDFTLMPEMSVNNYKSWLASIGGLTSWSQEDMAAVYAKQLNVGVKKDSKGNLIFTSGINGRDYIAR